MDARLAGPGARAQAGKALRRAAAIGVAAVAWLSASTSLGATAGVPLLLPHGPLAGPTYPAGFNPNVQPEAPLRSPLLPGSSYDPNRVDEKYAEFQQAAALPEANGNLAWKDVGPTGVENPTGYPTSTEQFLRVGGMGTAIAADTNDPSGNTVYFGDFGGVWKSTNGGTSWTNLSDDRLTSVGIGAIALDPANPGDIFVGTGVAYMTISGDTYGTGFYVSHNGGQTFSRPSPNVSGWAVTSIRVGANGLVLVGTNHGLYRSTDHGNTLSLVALPDNAAHNGPASGPYANWISDIAVRPGHPNEVTVAVGWPFGKLTLRDGSIGSPGNGLYRSTAGGAPGSFTAMSVSGLSTASSSSDPIGRISLEYSPIAGMDSVLWAVVSDAGLASGGTEFGDLLPQATGTNFNGLYRSGDDGATWANKADPQTLLTAPNSTLTPAVPLGYPPGVQTYYEVPLALDPVVADQAYFGLEEAYSTFANSGGTPGPAGIDVIERYADICGFYLFFTNITNGVACPTQTPIYGGYTTHPDQHAMVAVKTPTGSRLYSANDGGLFREDSHAVPGFGTGFDNNSWTSLNHLPTLEPWHVAMMSDGEILAALQDNGVSLSGADRNGVQVGLGDGVYVFPTTDTSVFYLSVPGAGLFVTTDKGHNVREMQPNLSGATFLSPIAVDPTDPNHLIAAGQNVEESLKGPSTQTVSDTVATGKIISTDWTQSFDAGTSSYKSPFTGSAVGWTAAALTVRDAAAYATMCVNCSAYRESFGDVHVTVATNVKAGCTAAKGSPACWHLAAASGLPPGYLGAAVIDPLDPKTVYAGVTERQLLGYPASDVGGRVFVSHDGANSFTDVTGNLPRGSVWRLVVRGNQLIAATDTGVFTSTLGTSTWSRLSTGLPHVQVRDAWIDPSGRYLLVSAYGRGVWELDFGAPQVNSNMPAPAPNTSAGRPLPVLPAVLLGLAALLAAGGRRGRQARRPA